MAKYNKEKSFKKIKAHQIYKKADGTPVIGVTTALQILNKPFLVTWANRLGLEGIDSVKFVDQMATIGTLAHEMIECYLKEEHHNTDEYAPVEIEMAQVCFGKFLAWLNNNNFIIEESEISLVSEEFGFGGTIDLYGTLNGRKVLIDIKTGKSIYPEYFTQLSAYRHLLKENGYPVDDVYVLRLGRDEKEGFEFRQAGGLDLHFEKFLACLKIAQINKELE